MNESISVIIPTYNRPKMLNRALNSVINQKYDNMEILIIDDSNKKEEKIKNQKLIEKINNEKIIYLQTAGSEGGGKARNIGIENSKGKYIAFLDDDDIWLNNKLKKQMKKFKMDNSICAVYCIYDVHNKKGKIIRKIRHRNKGNIYKKLLNSFCISETSSIIIKKEALEKINGFDTSLIANQEYDLYIRLSEHCNFDFVDEILITKIESEEERISSDFNKKIMGLNQFFKKHRKRYKSLSIKYRVFAWARYIILYLLFNLGKVVGPNIYKLIYFFKKGTS